MGTKVYVACEDPLLDQHIAVPVLTALFRHGLGRRQARVLPITNPRIRGVENLLAYLPALAERYAPLATCVAFVADLDAQDGRAGTRDRRAAFADRIAALPTGTREKALVILAVQELEVWALWGSRAQIPDSWSTVRRERDPKERYFEPLLTDGDRMSLGRGRVRLVNLSLGSGWQSLRNGCPELRDAEAELKSQSW